LYSVTHIGTSTQRWPTIRYLARLRLVSRLSPCSPHCDAKNATRTRPNTVAPTNVWSYDRHRKLAVQPCRDPTQRDHAPADCAARGALHDHPGPEHEPGRLYLLFGPHYSFVGTSSSRSRSHRGSAPTRGPPSSRALWSASLAGSGLAGWMADGDCLCACPQVEEGLNHLPVVPKTVQTPTGAQYDGVGFEGRICGVSILRSGEVRVSPSSPSPRPIHHT